MKAADIPDELLLSTVKRLGVKPGTANWAFTWDLFPALPQYPPKVILAKARSLIKRGLLDGCTCGCRGDFVCAEDRVV